MAAELKPKTLSEALDALSVGQRKIVGGGTDLMVRYRSWTDLPADIPARPLFTGGIDELHVLKKSADGLHIGGAVTLSELLADPETPSCLRQAIRAMAAPGIRNVATLAGNICNASPAGDTLPVLYALDAAVLLRNKAHARWLPVSSFITGPGRTLLQADELLTEICIPPSVFDLVFYHKIGPRRAQAISKLSFVGLARSEKGKIMDFRTAFGAVGPTVVRRPELEHHFFGMRPSEIDDVWIRETEELYDPFIHPIDDQRSTAAYRKQAALGLLKRFLMQAVQKNAAL